jgi:hypothetical protein
MQQIVHGLRTRIDIDVYAREFYIPGNPRGIRPYEELRAETAALAVS